ncbi:MAG: hypothetical protein ACPGWR_00225 [Ardenticatenaceae bacterium]
MTIDRVRAIFFGSLLLLLLAGAGQYGHAACQVRTNQLGVATLQNLLATEAAPTTLLVAMPNCPEELYIGTAYLLSDHQTKKALDYWFDAPESLKHRQVTLFPELFQLGLAARRAEPTSALAAYRQMFGVASFKAGWDLSDIKNEYQQTLIRWYASREEQLDTMQGLRHALWLWRAGDSEVALVRLEQVQATDLNPNARPRLDAYRNLIQAERLQAEGDLLLASQLLAKIGRSERSVFLRALLQQARLSTLDSVDAVSLEWKQVLANWQPSLSLDYTVVSLPARLVGAEILEPELIADGGEVCVLLFWQSKFTNRLSVAELAWLEVQDGQYVQEVCAYNLIQDPSFEWPKTEGRESLSESYGDLYKQYNNPPRQESAFVEGLLSQVVCLANPTEDGFSGVYQGTVKVKPTDHFLITAHMNSQDGANGILMGSWQKTRSYDLFYIGNVPKEAGWQWVGGVVSPPNEAWGAQVYGGVNYDAPGTVCVDDIMMLRLALP